MNKKKETGLLWFTMCYGYKRMKDDVPLQSTSINWSRILTHKSTQEIWDISVKHFTYAINRYISITTKLILCNTKSWIDHNVKSHR